MELMEAVKARHSVRSYTGKAIEPEKASVLQNAVNKINSETGLDIRLFLNEPNVFLDSMAAYGRFDGCRDYIALPAGEGNGEAAGYYGEELVLIAQTLGLNTCWIAKTYSEDKVPMVCRSGERLYAVIALGYGVTQGIPHKSKPMEALCGTLSGAPDWFASAMECVILAPTALNKQDFTVSRSGDTVHLDVLPSPYSQLDTGIIKYHFELGAGNHAFKWA